MIAELIQVSVYGLFTIIVKLTGRKGLYCFALGFVLAVGIPSILLGFGFTGIKPAFHADMSTYSRIRGLSVANGIWGIFHFILAFILISKTRDFFKVGINKQTVLACLGFCVTYIPFSLMQA
jgi:hypothetical protein